MANKRAWSEDRLATLRRLAADNFYSRDIAIEMGVSKNSVVAACHRWGIQLLQPRSGANGSNVRPAAIRNATKPRRHSSPNFLFRDAVNEVEGLGISLLDLADNSCRYPTTETTPFLFCGHPQQTDSSYCPAHHRVCCHKPHNVSEAAREKARERAYWMRKFAPARAPKGGLAASIIFEAAE